MKISLAMLFCLAVTAPVAAQSRTPGEMKWDYPLSSPAVFCPPLGTNGLLYFGTDDGTFRAVDAATGQFRWERPLVYRLSPATLGPDGTVYVGSGRTLYALDGNTGAQRWVFSTEDEVVSASVSRDTVYLSAGDVFALNAASGAEIWRAHVAATTPLALGPDQRIFLGTSGGSILALDAGTGNPLWSFYGAFSTPAIGPDGTIYAGTPIGGTFYALEGATGEQLWEFSTGWTTASSPAIGPDGTVYVGAHHSVYALDGVTGAERWRFQSSAWGDGPPAVTADGVVYFGASDALYALESATGEMRWAFQPGGLRFSAPNVGPDGTVFVGTGARQGMSGASVYAVHGTAALADSAWPKFQQNAQNTGRWNGSAVPRITRHPRSRALPVGSSVAFHFYAPVERPLHVQWRRNGAPMAGATNESLVLTNVQFADAGAYSVIISNQHGAATSEDGVLSVGYTLGVETVGRGEVLRDVELTLYPSNATVQLTALPQGDRNFLGWSGAVTGMTNPLTLILRSNTQVTARFDFDRGDVKWFSDFGDAPALGTNGVLYAYSEGWIVALDSTDGRTIFRTAYFDSWWAPGAIGLDGTLYIGNYSGSSVWSHHGTTGEQEWGFNVGVCVHACPTIGVDGTLYLAGAKIYAVDPATRGEKWSFEGGDIFESSPALSPDAVLYAGCYDGKMYALNAMTGAMLWEFVTGGGVHSAPALGLDDTVYFGSADGKVYALNGGDGQKRWEFATGGSIVASPVIGPDGSVYIGSTDSNVYALNGQTGKMKWQYAAEEPVTSTAALAADGTLYIGRAALDSRTGQKMWDLAAGGGTPTIGPDGTVYSGGYALHGTSPLAESPWPKFHRTLDNRGRAHARPILNPVNSRLTGEGFALTLDAELGDLLTVQWTSDFLNWTPLQTVTNTTGRIQCLDAAPTTGRRFYGVLAVPAAE